MPSKLQTSAVGSSIDGHLIADDGDQGFFLTSLVRLHWPRTPGVDVLWRSLTWAVGLVLLSGLCLSQADPRLQGRWTIAGDLFAFLTPVWILRLWFGSMEAIVKNESVSKRMP